MEKKPLISNDRPISLWLTALVLLAVIAGVDFATGYEARFYVFYFPPVWLLARYLGRGSGIAIAIIAAVVWYLVDKASGDTITAAIGFWNGVVTLAGYLAIAYAGSSLGKKIIEAERLKAELAEANARIEQLQVALPMHHFTSGEPSKSSLRLASPVSSKGRCE